METGGITYVNGLINFFYLFFQQSAKSERVEINKATPGSCRAREGSPDLFAGSPSQVCTGQVGIH